MPWKWKLQPFLQRLGVWKPCGVAQRYSCLVGFCEALQVSHEIFGDHTFKIRDLQREWKLSQPLYNAVI